VKRSLLSLLLIIVLVVLDQITKIYILQNFTLGESRNIIPGFFSLAYVQNTGAAFGFMRDGPEWFRQIFFLALPVLFCGWILWMYYQARKGPWLLPLAYTLILAGATGNLIDRFRLGFVVDMFMFFWKIEENHFHVFNVADSCVTIAGFLLAIDFFLQWKNKAKG
jgi:signal peptidase II